MAYKILKEVTDSSRRYRGQIVFEQRLFVPGQRFDVQLKDRYTGKVVEKLLGKSGKYFDFWEPKSWENSPPYDFYPEFGSMRFTENGLEVSVQMKNGNPKPEQKTITIPILSLKK